MASDSKPTKPYAIYLDRTTKMRERYFPRSLVSMHPSELKELHDLVECSLNASDKIFTFNWSTKDSVINDYHVDHNKVTVVGSGVNTHVSTNLKKPPSKLVLTVCSDFNMHKGQLSLDSFKLAQYKVPEATFIFVGDNPRETGNKIKYLPFLTYDKLIQLYAQASIVIMPASLGGMQSITEAMANKCVCIANAENPYTSGLIIDKENGFLFSKDDPSEIADLIAMSLSDRDLLESIGQKAQRHILEKYTWTSVATKMTKHLKELL